MGHPAGEATWKDHMEMKRHPREPSCFSLQLFESSQHQPAEKAMALHSSTVAWKILWTEEPGRLQSMGVTKSRTRLSDFTFTFLFHALEKEMTIFSHSEGCLFTLLIVSYTKETRIERDTCTPMFIAALFIISSNLNVNQQTNG